MPGHPQGYLILLMDVMYEFFKKAVITLQTILQSADSYKVKMLTMTRKRFTGADQRSIEISYKASRETRKCT